MEHRKFERIELKNYCVDASDGRGFFQGEVSNGSRSGLCLKGLPKRIDATVKFMTIIVSGQGKNFKMKIRPRWTSTDGVSKSIGAEILNASWGWVDFIKYLEPKVDQDVWATVVIK